MAWVLLALYAFTFLVMIIYSCVNWCCFNCTRTLGGYWKYFLHMWMKLQLVAFFIILAFGMPCCVKAFLYELYRIAVSWDHNLRYWIDNANEGNGNYERWVNKPLPPHVTYVNIKAWILHNLAIFFIVQLVIILFYFMIKIWDCFRTTGRSCMFGFLNFMEYTALIVGYLLIIM